MLRYFGERLPRFDGELMEERKSEPGHSSPSCTTTPLIARVLAVARLKSVTFLYCRSNSRVFQAVLESSPPPDLCSGSFISARGEWQPYGGKRPGFGPHELLVKSIDMLAVPADYSWRAQEEPRRRMLLRARSEALGAVETYFAGAEFVRVETPLIVGQEAAAGTTRPFEVRQGNESAYLTVNNLITQQKYQQAGLQRVYQFSRLFWAHKLRNRFSANEFQLLEYSLRGTVESIREVTEAIMEAIRCTLAELWTSAAAKTWAQEMPSGLVQPLKGLPVLSHDQVMQYCYDANLRLEGQAHVLPTAVDAIILKKVHAPGYWLVDSPGETSPFYARRRVGAGNRVFSCDVELRLGGVPNVGAGSEWNTDPGVAELAVQSWSNANVAAGYVSFLRNGLPGASGFTLGLDRLLMGLLGVGHVDQLTVEPRHVHTFRNSPSARFPLQRNVAPCELRIQHCVPNASACTRAAAALRSATRLLDSSGFLPCTTSAVGAWWERGWSNNSGPEIAWFESVASFTGLSALRHHRLLTEGVERIYEIGALVPSEPWWNPGVGLAVSWVGNSLREVLVLARRVLNCFIDGISPHPRQEAKRTVTRRTLSPPRGGGHWAARGPRRDPAAFELLLKPDFDGGRERVAVTGGLLSNGVAQMFDRTVKSEAATPGGEEFRDASVNAARQSALDSFFAAAPPPAGTFLLRLDSDIWGANGYGIESLNDSVGLP